jgi:acetylornithine deacetylase/succinyl-diaminopimelate desuccinylase-like protein
MDDQSSMPKLHWACYRAPMKQLCLVLAIAFAHAGIAGQTPQALQPDWPRVENETLQHFQALLRLDTSNPPGNETLATDYLRQVLAKEGIPAQIFALEPGRANLVARLKGNGSKRPLLIAGHTDVVTVDPAKWTHGPFAAVRDGGYVYGRGALDDKDNLVAALMVILKLKRLGVPMDRDVIFLAEAGEEGATRVGIDFLVEKHLPDIEAEFCLAEGGGIRREGGGIRHAAIGTLEKIPRTIELIARGPASHGSVPMAANAVSRLATAITALNAWQPPVRLNETTREYFRRLADISPPAEAARYRALLGADAQAAGQAARYLQEREPGHAALLRTTISPTIVRAGFRYNVIPSEATATLDVRILPDEDPNQMIAAIQKIIADGSIEVALAQRDGKPRPPGGSRVNTEAFRAIESAIALHYDTVSLPAMSTGASDMAQMRAAGIQCYGIGPAVDVEDGAKGFGAHGDQERILERELHRFVRFTWDVVVALARNKN